MAPLSSEAPSAVSRSNPTRRAHRKSRNGCAQCKQRHVKCDELHPVCSNCSATERQCSFRRYTPGRPYSDEEGTLNSNLTDLPGQAEVLSPAGLGTSPASLGTAIRVVFHDAGPVSPTAGLSTHGYDLAHLELLHHLEKQVLRPDNAGFVPEDVDRVAMADMFFKSATAEFYLMDELLAVSALHLSTTTSEKSEQQEYLHQAAQLQARALSVFNSAHPAVSDDNCVAMFLFSAVLGVHTLFDAVALHHDFSQFLDKLIQFLSLHRGIRTVTHQSWHILSQTELRHLLDKISKVEERHPDIATLEAEFETLKNYLAASDDSLGATAVRSCLEAVQSLDWIAKQRSHLGREYRAHIVLSWPSLIPFAFLEMLRQRRPEALVILAHWAVFLHQDREFWVFGDSGRAFIESAGRYLGPYWDGWMTWPNDMLQAT